MASSTDRKRVLALSSGGGHWVQLTRVLPAFEGCELVLASVDRAYAQAAPAHARFHVFNDATRWNKLALVRQAARILRILLKERPDVILSTGAAPGYLALRMGKWLRARTVWIDSIANVERLSLSGERAGKFADLWLTQWPHLASPEGPRYEGDVL